MAIDYSIQQFLPKANTIQSQVTSYCNPTYREHLMQWHGGCVDPIKSTSTTQVLFQNVWGFTVEQNNNTLRKLICLQEAYHRIDIVYMSEHHQDTTNFKRIQELQNITRWAAPGRVITQFDLSQESSLYGIKYGGTGIVVVGDMVGRSEPSSCCGDSMGRWSYIQFQQKKHPPFFFFSAYQAGEKPTQ